MPTDKIQEQLRAQLALRDRLVSELRAQLLAANRKATALEAAHEEVCSRLNFTLSRLEGLIALLERHTSEVVSVKRQ